MTASRKAFGVWEEALVAPVGLKDGFRSAERRESCESKEIHNESKTT